MVDEGRKLGIPLGQTFSVKDLQNALQDPTPRRARKWLEAFSAPVSDLKKLAETERRYTSGEMNYQLLPLERYPVIQLEDNEFIIPDAYSFGLALGNLIDIFAMTALPQKSRSRVRATLGYIQELYIADFTQAILPTAILIPEREYRNGKNDVVRGADLTIVQGDSAVLVESKAMLFPDIARVGAGPDDFATVDRKMTEVVQKAQWKAADLLDIDIHTYDPFRDALNQVNKDKIVTLIVHAERLTNFNVTWFARIEDPKHPLHGQEVKFYALSVEAYTDFLEAAGVDSILSRSG